MPYQGRLPYTYKSPYNYTLDQGTQTVPSLAFLGDTNNGLFSPATDVVAITTNGSEKLRITDTGNVGIGTTNPEDRLDLASGFIRFKEAIGGTGTYGGIRAYNSLVPSVSATAIRFIRDVAEVGNDGAICFDTTNNERLRITSTGNVGIGTTNPTSKLSVYGGLSIGTSSASGSAHAFIIDGFNNSASNHTLTFSGHPNGTNDSVTWYLNRTGGAYGNFDVQFNGTSRFYISGGSLSNNGNIILNPINHTVISSGNVGIGTTDPTSILDVRSSASDSSISIGRPSLTPTISLANNGGQNSGRIIVRHDNAAVIEFRADGNGSYINTGNFGIGTNNPTEKLTIYEGKILVGASPESNTTGEYELFRGFTYLTAGVQYGAVSLKTSYNNTTNTSSLNFYVSSGGTNQGVERMRLTGEGNVGIGTTNPSEKLEVTGKVRIFDGGYPYIDIGITTSNYFRIIHDNPNDRLFIGKNNNASLVITGGNNVEPGADATQNLGSSTKRWANIYSADLQLSNEGSQNDVDGTWGQYTIQEGENDLFLLNRRNGKKYKFVLQEVN